MRLVRYNALRRWFRAVCPAEAVESIGARSASDAPSAKEGRLWHRSRFTAVREVAEMMTEKRIRALRMLAFGDIHRRACGGCAPSSGPLGRPHTVRALSSF
jgi:hypothetical protein